ncbi:MAG: DUF6568 family protein [Bacilli bacterium]
MKLRNIPKKNYIILAAIFILTIIATFYFASWYKALNEYYKTNSVITEVISEMESETLSSYIMDNPETIIYLSSSTDMNVKKFEKKFKKMIIEKELSNDIIFLDLAKEENDDFANLLLKNYMSKRLNKIQNILIPNLIYFSNGEVTDILYIKETDINTDDVKNFLERIKIINND